MKSSKRQTSICILGFPQAGRCIENFVVNDLSNWYVRRSRRRLWEESASQDKLACQHSLHHVLSTLCRLIAPISPFMADSMHRNFVGTSVHLLIGGCEKDGTVLANMNWSENYRSRKEIGACMKESDCLAPKDGSFQDLI